MGKASKPIGAYLPGTVAGEKAAQFWADLYVHGERQGGITGMAKQITGGLFGGLASLWTPETAAGTAFTLSTAGLGALANAGRLGALSKPVISGFQVLGAAQGGLSAGQALTGENLRGEKLSSWERGVHGATAALTIVVFFSGPKSVLFGRKGPGLREQPGVFNKGATRVGWSWRGKNLPGAGDHYFSLHGGGVYKNVNQGPHWHLYPNHGWPSGPNAAPSWAHAVVWLMRSAGIFGSGALGWELGQDYLLWPVEAKPAR